jgi:hypothetical protein
MLLKNSKGADLTQKIVLEFLVVFFFLFSFLSVCVCALMMLI